MSAIDELRRMLDERGADYRVSATGYSIEIGPYTTAYANRSDTTLDVSLRQVTPEQAIDATLGRRATTRCGKFRTKYGRSVPCCECCGYGIGDERWHYCPSCGAKVVDA